MSPWKRAARARYFKRKARQERRERDRERERQLTEVAARAVDARFAPLRDSLLVELRDCVHAADAIRASAFWSRCASLLGIKTAAYRAYRAAHTPLIEQQRTLRIALRDLELSHSEERTNAAFAARDRVRRERTAAYEAWRAYCAERAQRSEERRSARRMRYLESFPSIRSAARMLRKLMLAEHHHAGTVQCYYCAVIVPLEKAHLDHKRPVVRGGRNRRGNLAFACAPCNLAKGSKTEAEFRAARTEP